MKRWLVGLALVCGLAAGLEAQPLTGGLLGRPTADYAYIPAPSGCAAASVMFFGTPVTVGPKCDTGFTYDPATDTLTTGRVLVSGGSAAAPSVGVSPDTGIYDYAAGAWLGLAADGRAEMAISGGMFGLQPNAHFQWSSAGLGTATDLGLARYSPGVLRVTDGNAGYGKILADYGTVAAPGFAFGAFPGFGLFLSGGTALVHNGVVALETAASAIRIGSTPNANPVANTLIVGESGSGTDIAGANGVIQSGAGTGSGAGSSLIFKIPLAHASDAVAQSYSAVMTFSENGGTVHTPIATQHVSPSAADTSVLGGAGNEWKTLSLSRAILGSKAKALTDNTATDFASFTIADGYDYAGELLYKVRSVKGTAIQSLGANLPFVATREGTTYTVTVNGTFETASKTLAGAGTLTGGVTLACTAGVCTFTATFDTSQSSPDTMSISSRVNSTDAGLSLTFIP